MNTNLTGLFAFLIGAVLIYAAIKDKSPADIFKESVGQKPPAKSSGNPKSNSGGGSQQNSYSPMQPYYSPSVPV